MKGERDRKRDERKKGCSRVCEKEGIEEKNRNKKDGQIDAGGQAIKDR